MLKGSDYRTNLSQDDCDSIADTKKWTEVTTSGNYSANLSVANLTGNYRILIQIHSYEYTTGKMNLDVTQLYLSI